MNTRSFLIHFKEYALITIGLLGYVMGWILFLIPNNLIGGGRPLSSTPPGYRSDTLIS